MRIPATIALIAGSIANYAASEPSRPNTLEVRMVGTDSLTGTFHKGWTASTIPPPIRGTIEGQLTEDSIVVYTKGELQIWGHPTFTRRIAVVKPTRPADSTWHVKARAHITKEVIDGIIQSTEGNTIGVIDLHFYQPSSLGGRVIVNGDSIPVAGSYSGCKKPCTSLKYQ